jgi:hypothetical protein
MIRNNIGQALMCFQLQVVVSVLSLSSQLTTGHLESGRKHTTWPGGRFGLGYLRIIPPYRS